MLRVRIEHLTKRCRKMNNRLLSYFLRIIILLCVFLSCSRHKEIDGISVSEMLLIVSKEQSIDYCSILHDAVNGDSLSIRRLASLDFYDSIAYDHGAVLVDLIMLIGEDAFVQSLNSIGTEQKEQVKSYIIAGLEYGSHTEWNYQMFQEVFPKLYAFVN